MKPPIEFRPSGTGAKVPLKPLSRSASGARTEKDDAASVGATPGPASGFDRTAYQREYMRRYRAKNAGK